MRVRAPSAFWSGLGAPGGSGNCQTGALAVPCGSGLCLKGRICRPAGRANLPSIGDLAPSMPLSLPSPSGLHAAHRFGCRMEVRAGSRDGLPAGETGRIGPLAHRCSDPREGYGVELPEELIGLDGEVEGVVLEDGLDLVEIVVRVRGAGVVVRLKPVYVDLLAHLRHEHHGEPAAHRLPLELAPLLRLDLQLQLVPQPQAPEHEIGVQVVYLPLGVLLHQGPEERPAVDR
mmetsp:Transcript_7909/g.18952  ORF Transcript_7909/g.18952 Transcript_7909/m.18952 type:complete len:231 (-) Transcript_7909:1254-1946(-)